MNIDNYLKQLAVDIDNQKLQETILNKSAKTTTFDFKIKNMTQPNTNATQVSSFLKNDIIDKLNRLVDSVTAMRVYNFLTSNNLMDTFLKSYEYLLNYKNYNVMSYNDIINYILSYQSSSKGMLDFLKDDLKEKLKSKSDIVQLKQLNKITTNANMKNKIKIASQKIPTQEKINKIENINILQQMINDADFLPDKKQLDEILSRTRRTKMEMAEVKLMGFEDIRSLENKQSKLERKMKKQAEKAEIIESQYPTEYSEKVTTEYETKILSKNKFDDPEYDEDLKQNYMDKYNVSVNNEIQIDNKELDIIMEELNKKSQFEEQEESFQSLSQETNITEEELSQELENISQEFEDIMTPTKSQDTLPEIDDPNYDIKIFNLKEKMKTEEEEEENILKDEELKRIKEEERLEEEAKKVSTIILWKNTYKLNDEKIKWGLTNNVTINKKKGILILNPKNGKNIPYNGPVHQKLTEPNKKTGLSVMSPIIYKDFINS